MRRAGTVAGLAAMGFIRVARIEREHRGMNGVSPVGRFLLMATLASLLPDISPRVGGHGIRRA